MWRPENWRCFKENDNVWMIEVTLFHSLRFVVSFQNSLNIFFVKEKWKVSFALLKMEKKNQEKCFSSFLKLMFVSYNFYGTLCCIYFWFSKLFNNINNIKRERNLVIFSCARHVYQQNSLAEVVQKCAAWNSVVLTTPFHIPLYGFFPFEKYLDETFTMLM